MAGQPKLRAQAIINATHEARSKPKRSRTSKGQSEQSDHVTWERRQELGGVWALSEDSWPVQAIVGERIIDGVHKYQLKWDPHPDTGESFAPTWEPAENATDPDLVREWKFKQRRRGRLRQSASASDQEDLEEEITRSSRKTQRRTIARRIVQSSSDTEQVLDRPPQAATELQCVDSEKNFVSQGPQVPETQQAPDPKQRKSLEVRIPFVPTNAADYESISNRSSGSTLSSQIQSQLGPTVGSANKPQNSVAALNSSPFEGRSTRLALDIASTQSSLAATGSVTQTSSPIGTEDSSDLFFPSPRQRHTPLTSSLEASPQTQSQSNPSQEVNSPHISSTNSSCSTQAIFSSSQRLIESIEDSQKQAGSLYSINPSIQSTQSASSAFRPQISPSAFDRSLLLQRHPRSPPKRSLLHQSLPATSLTSSLGRNSRTGPSGIAALRQTSLPISRPAMATPRGRSPPKGRSITPSTDPKGSSDFADQIRNVRRTRRNNEITQNNSEMPAIRQPTPVMLGKTPRQPEVKPSPLSIITGETNDMQIDPVEPALSATITPPSTVYNTALGSSAMPVQQSVEYDFPTSTDNSNSTSDSGRIQIQQSVENERQLPQSGGFMMPTKPIFDEAEYAIALPAEGKLQSVYHDTISSKRKSLLKFVRKRDSNGVKSSPPSKTEERNEMAQLIERLNDTVTHTDLALDDYGTQYSSKSEELARYAPYASSKFAFLGHLIDHLRGKECFIVLVAKSGRVQDLLEGFLMFKKVRYQRSPADSAMLLPADPSTPGAKLQFALLASGSSIPVDLPETPAVIIAFDASFDSQDAQIKKLRKLAPDTMPVPIVHFLVTNSSEHVDQCIPRQLPSPQRLRLLVRATYQARSLIGGEQTVVYHEDELSTENGGINLTELQIMLKKSPERKLDRLAEHFAIALTSIDFRSNWEIDKMPDLFLEELEDTPINPDRTRAVTPVSRAGTPSARKRLLESDNPTSLVAKRQRLTPLHDVTNVSNSAKDPTSQLELIQKQLLTLKEELASEKAAKTTAELARDSNQQRLDENIVALRKLNSRYETRMKKNHDQDKEKKALQTELETRNSRHERTVVDNLSLKDEVQQLKADLATARAALKSEGGDIAALELAQEEARNATWKAAVMERSLENCRKDFEFTRTQYQEASTKAADFASQVSELETQYKELAKQASDEKRRLREINYQTAMQTHLNRIAELEGEKKVRESLLKRLEEEVRVLKKARSGVQTRGSSVQPPGSPGHVAPRSRQGSPAPGSTGIAVYGHTILPGGRAATLRNER